MLTSVAEMPKKESVTVTMPPLMLMLLLAEMSLAETVPLLMLILLEEMPVAETVPLLMVRSPKKTSMPSPLFPVAVREPLPEMVRLEEETLMPSSLPVTEFVPCSMILMGLPSSS